MDGRRAGHAGDGGLEGPDAPALDLVEIDVEARLVELDHVGPRGGQGARLRVQKAGKAHRLALLVAPVVLVQCRVDDGHGSGQGDLHRAPGVGLGEGQRGAHDGAGPRHLADDPGHVLLRDVLAAAGSLLPESLRVDPGQAIEESPDVVPATLLAVADDVQAGLLLVQQRQANGVVLGLAEPIGRRHPRGKELVARIGEPGGLRKAARERGPEHGRATIAGPSRSVN